MFPNLVSRSAVSPFLTEERFAVCAFSMRGWDGRQLGRYAPMRGGLSHLGALLVRQIAFLIFGKRIRTLSSVLSVARRSRDIDARLRENAASFFRNNTRDRISLFAYASLLFGASKYDVRTGGGERGRRMPQICGRTVLRCVNL